MSEFKFICEYDEDEDVLTATVYALAFSFEEKNYIMGISKDGSTVTGMDDILKKYVKDWIPNADYWAVNGDGGPVKCKMKRVVEKALDSAIDTINNNKQILKEHFLKEYLIFFV